MRQDAMNALAEQRRHFRKRVFKPAQIVLSEKAPKLECNARDLSAQGVRLRLSTTYGIPHEFDVIIDGRRKPGRSIWRTDTEMGVMFSEASQQSADFMRHERDIAPLIELLKMAEEKWPSSEGDEISEIELLSRDQALLDMWPEACWRTGVPVHEFPIAVIKARNGLA
ncbi:MAG: PilZ domain-containing protein [Pseudolabrys sp.]